MICDYCATEFEVSKKGSGGKNRLFCFSCLPEGLPRDERNRIRHKLYGARTREYKESKGCALCGYSAFGGALEWHHPEDNKDGNAADVVRRSWAAYLEEVSKCVLLCACCHREVHEGIRRV